MRFTCDLFCPDIAIAFIALLWGMLSDAMQYGIFYVFWGAFLIVAVYIFSGIQVGERDAV